MPTRVVSGFALAALTAAAFAACKDGGGPPPPVGPPAKLVNVTSGTPSAPANTAITNLRVQVQDANGTPVPNQPVTFGILEGDGSLAATTATSDESGTVTVPPWTMGKLAIPQKLRATLGNITLTIEAQVATLYKIDVRFFGTPMTSAQQTLFRNAAARISGVVTGDVLDAQATNAPVATACNMPGQPDLNELIDDIIIFAAIEDIDGPGRILAQSGPCLYRDVSRTRTDTVYMPAVAKMQFDRADIDALAGAGSLQEVITHEMLHALGVGVLWEDRRILTGKDTPDPRYTGAQGRAGCQEVGGTVTCASSVPVEGTGGQGTANSHWRESTFRNELMTGFIDASPNPFSLITVRSLADLSYVVNPADSDPYTIPGGSVRAGSVTNTILLTQRPGWESRPPSDYLYVLHRDGHVSKVRKR